jgi:ABC-type transport system involved in cytochrome c biogenesis permease subunit
VNSALLTAVAFGLYLASAVCYGAILFLDSPSAPAAMGSKNASTRPARYGAIFVVSGVVVLFAAIGANCMRTHHSPFASEFGTLVVAAWVISIIYLVVDRKARMPALGAVAMLAVCIVLGFAYAHAHAHISLDPLLGDQIVTIHVVAIVASFGLILVASCCAGLYVIEDRLLKRHSKSHVLRKLPALTTLDTIAFQCIAYALPLLTLGLGVALAIIFGGGTKTAPGVWFAEAQFISSAALWLLFVAYLTARLTLGWRGVRLQYILLVGILCAFATYALPTASAHHFN